jgi:DNA-binding transcriptional regulator YhcF (GntR family)
LSAELGISRNTVSAAYKELLLEGVLEACQGRGTFVKRLVDRSLEPEVAGSRRERVLKVIDKAMADALGLGFSVDQFSAIVSIRAQEKMLAVRELRVAVVDCTAEYIQRFIKQIGQQANIRMEAVVLSEIISGKVPLHFLQACDMVITTAEHQPLLAGLMGTGNKLISVSVIPNLEAVIKLARLPVNTVVGVIARTPEFAQTLEELLLRANISGLQVAATQAVERDELGSFVAKHPVLVVSEERENLVRQIVVGQQEIITFYYEIDQGSLQQLMVKLVSKIL